MNEMPWAPTTALYPSDAWALLEKQHSERTLANTRTTLAADLERDMAEIGSSSTWTAALLRIQRILASLSENTVPSQVERRYRLHQVLGTLWAMLDSRRGREHPPHEIAQILEPRLPRPLIVRGLDPTGLRELRRWAPEVLNAVPTPSSRPALGPASPDAGALAIAMVHVTAWLELDDKWARKHIDDPRFDADPGHSGEDL